MIKLVQFQFIKALRQKAFIIYLLAYCVMTVSECLSFRQNPNSDFAQLYTGGRFLIYTLQLQAALIGPLFFLLLASFAINSEKTAGTFHLPLINGISKKQLLHSKFLHLFILLGGSTLLIEFFAFFIILTLNNSPSAFYRLSDALLSIALTIIPLFTTCMGAVLLCLYTKNVAVTMGIGLLFLLFDNLLNQFMAPIVSKFSFMYYNYAFSLYNGRELLLKDILVGIGLSILYAGLFYFLALRKINLMEY